MTDILFGELTHPDLKDLEHAVVIPYYRIRADTEPVLRAVRSKFELRPGESILDEPSTPSYLGKRYQCALALVYYEGVFASVVSARYEKVDGADRLVETVLLCQDGEPVEIKVVSASGTPREHKYLDGTGYIGNEPIALGCGTEVLCTKAGGSTPYCRERSLDYRMALQVPRPLPSSD